MLTISREWIRNVPKMETSFWIRARMRIRGARRTREAWGVRIFRKHGGHWEPGRLGEIETPESALTIAKTELRPISAKTLRPQFTHYLMCPDRVQQKSACLMRSNSTLIPLLSQTLRKNNKSHTLKIRGTVENRCDRESRWALGSKETRKTREARDTGG